MKFVQPGETPPAGLSKHAAGYRLRLPLMVWRRKGYDINWDAVRTGWWVFNLVVKTEREYAYRLLAIRWGWVLLKETAPAEWYGMKA